MYEDLYIPIVNKHEINIVKYLFLIILFLSINLIAPVILEITKPPKPFLMVHDNGKNVSIVSIVSYYQKGDIQTISILKKGDTEKFILTECQMSFCSYYLDKIDFDNGAYLIESSLSYNNSGSIINISTGQEQITIDNTYTANIIPINNYIKGFEENINNSMLKIFKEEEEWNKFNRKYFSPIQTLMVDFDIESVILVSMEPQYFQGSYTISVEEIIEEKEKIFIYIQETNRPVSNPEKLDVPITSYFIAIAKSKFEKEVEFVYNE